MFGIMWLVKLMRDYALKEKYNIKRINNQIKENRLLFEIGEITEKEYKEKHEILLEELETAKEVMEKLSNVRIAEVQ
ncbi:MAG: hypothetical protein AABX74_01380 [Nanoarchaeota archaeon]